MRYCGGTSERACTIAVYATIVLWIGRRDRGAVLGADHYLTLQQKESRTLDHNIIFHFDHQEITEHKYIPVLFAVERVYIYLKEEKYQGRMCLVVCILF